MTSSIKPEVRSVSPYDRVLVGGRLVPVGGRARLVLQPGPALLLGRGGRRVSSADVLGLRRQRQQLRDAGRLLRRLRPRRRRRRRRRDAATGAGATGPATATNR